jgi:hypothetical protein
MEEVYRVEQEPMYCQSLLEKRGRGHNSDGVLLNSPANFSCGGLSQVQ